LLSVALGYHRLPQDLLGLDFAVSQKS